MTCTVFGDPIRAFAVVDIFDSCTLRVRATKGDDGTGRSRSSSAIVGETKLPQVPLPPHSTGATGTVKIALRPNGTQMLTVAGVPDEDTSVVREAPQLVAELTLLHGVVDCYS